MFPMRVKKDPSYRVLFALASGVLLILALSVVTGREARAEPVQSPATIWRVTSDQDGPGACPHPSNCTLRAAIAAANHGDSIEFALSLPATINLSAPLVIIRSITISGPAAGSVTIDGGGRFQLISIPGTSLGLRVTTSNLTLAHGKAGWGAAIYNDQAILTIRNSTLSGNSAGDSGGAIYNGSGTLTIVNSTLSGNDADGWGGAISNDNGTLTVVNSTLSGNDAGGWGGAISNDTGTLTVVNSTLSGNDAGGQGGAISNRGYGGDAAASILNSTIISNTGNSGGGIFNYSLAWCRVEPSGCTPGSAQITITNAIIAGNTSRTTGEYADCSSSAGAGGSSSLLSGGHNIVVNGACPFPSPSPDDAEPLNNKDELFSLVLDPHLTNHGGPTATYALDPPVNNRAVDAVPAAECHASTDQRGAPRPLGEHCDIGAYEAVLPAIEVTKTVGYKEGECGSDRALWVAPGGEVDYCVTIRNTGNVTLTGFTITDQALGIIDQAPLIPMLPPGSSASVTSQDIVGLGPVPITSDITNTIQVTGRNQALEDLGIEASADGEATAVVRPVSVFAEIEPGPGCNDLVCTRYITATVYSGTPDQGVAGLPFAFEVTGGSPAPYQEHQSNASGQAFFSYTSRLPAAPQMPSNAGAAARPLAAPDQLMDVLSVWVELDRNEAWNRAFEPGVEVSLPTAVTWSSFTGHSNDDGSVTLKWETALETETAGFNVHRAPSREGPYARINDVLIGAQGAGASYTYTDTPPGGFTYYYKVEEVGYNGSSTFHGPIEVRAAGDPPYRYHLPLVSW